MSSENAMSSTTSAEATAEAEAGDKWWTEQWLAFPTVSLDSEGVWHYWEVPEDSGVYAEDWKVGEHLARDTVAHMQRFPEGSSVMRRIMRDIDQDSIVSQGFVSRVEDMLANPRVYLDSLEPGAVEAKLRGED
mgnify:CR=1 FL=1